MHACMYVCITGERERERMCDEAPHHHHHKSQLGWDRGWREQAAVALLFFVGLQLAIDAASSYNLYL